MDSCFRRNDRTLDCIVLNVMTTKNNIFGFFNCPAEYDGLSRRFRISQMLSMCYLMGIRIIDKTLSD